MPNEKTDSAGFATENARQGRTTNALRDATASIGMKGSIHKPAGTIDTATMLAAKSSQPEEGDNVGEKKTEEE